MQGIDFFHQIDKVEDVNSLMRQLLFDSIDIVMEAGYSKPIASVAIDDKTALIRTLALHFTILRSKAVLDQFKEGLCTLGVIDAIKQHPSIMEPLFVANGQTQLTAGLHVL